MAEKEKESNFLSSMLTKESALAGSAIVVASATGYVNFSQISSLKETVKSNEQMLITTIKNVDQLVQTAPDPEKFAELKKSIELNSQMLSKLNTKMQQIEQIIRNQEHRLKSIEKHSEEWFGYFPQPEVLNNSERTHNQYSHPQQSQYQEQFSNYPRVNENQDSLSSNQHESRSYPQQTRSLVDML